MAQQWRILTGAMTVCSLSLFVPQARAVSPEEAQKIEAAAPAKAPAVPAKPRKLLVFNLTKGYVHTAIPYGAKALEALGAKTGAYEVVHSTDMSVFDAANLKQFDAICLNNSSQLDFSPDAQKAILDFVNGGKGIVGIHGATVNFAKWPEGAALLGGVFDGHPWVAEGTWAVKIDDPGHPLNAAFQGQGFKANDELYRTKFSYPPRENLRVLVSIDMSDEATRTAKGIRPGETDYPLSWIRTYGQGRVFYTSFAHNHHLYWNPAILGHILAGVQFALGDLPVDTTPSAKVAAGPGPGFRSLFNGTRPFRLAGQSRYLVRQGWRHHGPDDAGLPDLREQLPDLDRRRAAGLRASLQIPPRERQLRRLLPQPGAHGDGEGAADRLPGRFQRRRPLDRRHHGVHPA